MHTLEANLFLFGRDWESEAKLAETNLKASRVDMSYRTIVRYVVY